MTLEARREMERRLVDAIRVMGYDIFTLSGEPYIALSDGSMLSLTELADSLAEGTSVG